MPEDEIQNEFGIKYKLHWNKECCQDVVSWCNLSMWGQEWPSFQAQRVLFPTVLILFSGPCLESRAGIWVSWSNIGSTGRSYLSCWEGDWIIWGLCLDECLASFCRIYSRTCRTDRFLFVVQGCSDLEWFVISANCWYRFIDLRSLGWLSLFPIPIGGYQSWPTWSQEGLVAGWRYPHQAKSQTFAAVGSLKCWKGPVVWRVFGWICFASKYVSNKCIAYDIDIAYTLNCCILLLP